MQKSRGSLGGTLVVALVQTLVFGALLAILGYRLDSALQIQEQELTAQSQRTEALLSSLEPQIQQRRDAYIDFQRAAREARNILEVYY